MTAIGGILSREVILLDLYFHGIPLAAGWILDCGVNISTFQTRKMKFRERKNSSGVTVNRGGAEM